MSWFQDREFWDGAVPVDGGPRAWPRIPVRVVPDPLTGQQRPTDDRYLAKVEPAVPIPVTELPPVAVTDVRVSDDGLSFKVDRVGVPVLVRMSYFPNWKVSGAQGPFRAAPNFMVVVPTENTVRMGYGWTPIDGIASRHAALRRRAGRRLRRGRPGPGPRRRRPRPGLHRPALLRRRSPRRPGAMFTASHNPAQYNGIKMCLAGARPSARTPAWPRSRRWPVEDGVAGRATAGHHRPDELDLLDAFADHVRSFVDVARCARSRSWPTPPTAWAASWSPRCSRACPSTSRSCTASSTAPSPTTRPTRSSPRTCATCRPGCSRTAPTWAWPSTATPTGCSSSTSRASPCRARSPPPSSPSRRPREGARRHDPAQPHLLEGGARGRARARRHPGAHPGRPQLHQAGDGRDRRRLRRRALGALLLPRQLPGRLRGSSPRSSCSSSSAAPGAAVGAAQALRALRRLGRDQHRVDDPRR
jgi:hypothetical protein